MKFYPLTVSQIEKTTADCAVISFTIKEEWRTIFDYQHGQYLTLKAVINGEEVRRSYSLCSSPVDKEWKVAVKKIEDGLFSTFANDKLQVGDTLEVMPPNGRFFKEIETDKASSYVAFAAGSGITPILSIIKTHLLLEPKSSFQLFYINQTVNSIILKEEVEALRNLFLGRFQIFHFLTQEDRNIPLFNGRINEEKLEILFKSLVSVDETNDYFICGPEAMIFTIRDFLVEKGVDKKQIHFELFTSSTTKKAKTAKKRVVDNSVLSSITIVEGGKDFNFKIPRGSNNILDAALNKSADLPYACKGGVCCTCRAKLIEGDVEIGVSYGLGQEEIDEGYILTCQATPISEKVVVDFDA